MKRRKLRNTRPKALFGEGVAAAAITAAATMAAAGIGAAATSRAAREQSQATIQNAKQQADALAQTNQNNNMLQQQSQQFIAQENEANRQIQRDLQLSLQMQGGQLDSEQRRAASRIQVKKGGKVKSRKKLRDAQLPFYGGANLPFSVTDGGDVVPLGQTPEGYDLYEIVGNDHNHYHKTRSGKYKSGVGIKFANGEVVEGEGNQNSNQGEYLMVTPDSGVFISKHSINGFNPAQAVNAGMSPIEAYAIQEASKGTSPVKRNRHKALAGVSTNYIFPTDYPMDDIGFDMSGVNVALGRRSLKKGGRCKAANGNIIGGWITGVGNLGGGILSGLGNYWSNRYLANAYPKATEYLVNAYDNLKTVDTSSINRKMFSHTPYMPVVRSSWYNVNPELNDVSRQANSTMRAVKNTTLSSAARLSRMSGVNAAADAARSKIYAEKGNKEETIKQENLNRINEAAAKNAELAVQSSRDFTGHYLDLLKYNNDIVNQGITGKAQALANSIMGQAQARGAGTQGLWSNIGSGIAGFAGSVASGYAAAAKERKELDAVLWGSDLDNRVNYIAQNGDKQQRKATLDELNARLEVTTDPNDIAKLELYIQMLGGNVPKVEPIIPRQPTNRDRLQDYLDGTNDLRRGLLI